LRTRLDLAFQLAVSDLEDSQTPDPFRNADQDWRHERALDRLERALRNGTYRPELPQVVSLPKNEFASRPGKRISIDDLTVLFYITLGLAEVFEDRLRAGVTAYRVRRVKPTISAKRRYVLPRYLRRRHKIVDPWYDAWPKFHRQLQAQYALGRKYVGTSDITSFYEAIDLKVFRAVLHNEATRPLRPLVHLLADIYTAWSARDVHSLGLDRGIPQGTETSGVVANYFLMPFDSALDKYARSRALTWYRYSDDLRLIGRDRDAVRIGLRVIGEELSRLNLIQQAGKTEILTGQRARSELFDRRPDRIEAARKRIKIATTTRARNAGLGELDRVLETIPDAVEMDKLSSRALAMLYGAYGQAGSDRLLSRWRRDFLAEPQRSKTITSYLSGFLNRESRVKQLLCLIDEQKDRATDWELATLLRGLRRSHRLPAVGTPLLLSIARAKKRNWYVRQQAACCIGWFQLRTEARTLVASFEREGDDEVRRSLVPLSYLLDPAFETLWLGDLARDESPRVSRMANFLLALRTDRELAARHLRRFYSPDEVFLVDNVWRLYQIRHNPAVAVQLAATLTRFGPITNLAVRAHIRCLS